MKATKILAAMGLALGVAGAALAERGEHGSHGEHGDRMVKRHFVRHHGVEMAAMHNIMAELISARTGKSVGEVQAAFEDGHPHEAFEKLGLSEDDARALRKQAREKLVVKAQAAGLITSAQAEKIRSQPEPKMLRVPHPPAPPDAPTPPAPPSPPDFE